MIPLIAGDGLCDPEVVEIVVKEGPERIKEIIDYGTNFDKTNEGYLRPGKRRWTLRIPGAAL
jgi:aspartate oxidase